jgi:hypothetical protein
VRPKDVAKKAMALHQEKRTTKILKPCKPA